MHRKENLIGPVWVSSVYQPLAVESVFACDVYVCTLSVCLHFLKYLGLSVLGAVSSAGCLGGGSGGGNAVCPILQVQAPHIAHLPFGGMFFPPQDFCSLLRTN